MSLSFSPDRVRDLFASLHDSQLIFLALFVATAVLGGNAVIAMHYRRLGKPWWSIFTMRFSILNFDRKELSLLLAVLLVAMLFGVIALLA